MMKRPEYNKFLQLTLFGSALLLPILTFGVVWYLTRITSKEIEDYHQLMDKVTQEKSNGKVNTTTSQEREKVHKNFLFSQDGERLQLTIFAARSKLALEPTENGVQTVEYMDEVICFMQEQLYYLLPDGREATLQDNGQLLIKNADPKEISSWLEKETPNLQPMQLIRYMKAKEAIYFYRKEEFLGKDVSISTYALPGHHLEEKISSEKPLMQGVAKSVEFSLAGKELNFKAHQMKASFFANPGFTHPKAAL